MLAIWYRRGGRGRGGRYGLDDRGRWDLSGLHNGRGWHVVVGALGGYVQVNHASGELAPGIEADDFKCQGRYTGVGLAATVT